MNGWCSQSSIFYNVYRKILDIHFTIVEKWTNSWCWRFIFITKECIQVHITKVAHSRVPPISCGSHSCSRLARPARQHRGVLSMIGCVGAIFFSSTLDFKVLCFGHTKFLRWWCALVHSQRGQGFVARHALYLDWRNFALMEEGCSGGPDGMIRVNLGQGTLLGQIR